MPLDDEAWIARMWHPRQVLMADGRPLDNVLAVDAGVYFTAVLRNDSTVWAWGGNDSGPLGDGTTDRRLTPVPVRLENGKPLSGIIALSAGSGHTLALHEDRTVWVWGRRYCGEGEVSDASGAYARQVVGPDGRPLNGVRAIAAGGNVNWAIMGRQRVASAPE
jgi:alpha-tubulin suppressor-like RCC1 family protein